MVIISVNSLRFFEICLQRNCPQDPPYIHKYFKDYELHTCTYVHVWSEKVCYQKYVEKSAIHTGESLFIYHLLSNIIQKSCLWFGLVWHFWPSSASVHEQSALKISEKSRTFLNVPKCSIVSVLYFKTESLFSTRLFSTACPLFLLTYKFWGSFYSLLHRIDLTQEKIL